MNAIQFTRKWEEKSNDAKKDINKQLCQSVPINWSFEEMLISAERYACGRSSGIVQSTCWYILCLLPWLSSRTLNIMCNDFEAKKRECEVIGHKAWGMEQDEDSWHELWRIIISELKQREKRGNKDEND